MMLISTCLSTAMIGLQFISIVWTTEMKKPIEPVVLVHGGAGYFQDSLDHAKSFGCKVAAKLGYAKLMATGSVLDAVEEAVRSMESDVHFNAGYGSVLNFVGDVEMDASIMNGSNLNAGCCTLVRDIHHPISLAKTIMLQNQTFLGGPNVMRFARDHGIEILPFGSLVTKYAENELKFFKRELQAGANVTAGPSELDNRPANDEGGTVGAVAIDQFGNVAAATSTGGLTGKMPGRIGDSPVLGAGTYADNKMGAVSVTGNGETIMRYNVAQRILQRIELLGEDAQTAVEVVLHAMTKRLPYEAGATTLDKNGKIGIHFVSKKMGWAYRKGSEVHSGIRHGDDFIEDV